MCACVSVGLPCVCMYVGRSALCVSVGLPCVLVGLPCVLVGLPVGVDCANFVNLYEIKLNQIAVLPLHGAGRECHFLFSSAPLKYWKASCSKLAPPPPTHTIQYNTSQHKINHHCNQCFKDNVCKQRNLLVLDGWLS